MKLPLRIYFYTVIQGKVYRIAKFCRVLSNVYFQQNNLMNHIPKGHIYMHNLYIFLFSYILTYQRYQILETYHPQAESFKCLNITRLEVDAICRLSVPCQLHSHIRDNKATLPCPQFFVPILFYSMYVVVFKFSNTEQKKVRAYSRT